MGSNIDAWMRIQTEYISFKNCWRISSSCNFQAHLQRSQRCRLSQTALQRFNVLLGLSLVLPGISPALPGVSTPLPGVSPALPGVSPALLSAPKHFAGTPRCSHTYYNHSHHTPVLVIRDPSYSQGRPECPPTVWHSPEIDASKFALHILSDTPGGSQWLNYVLQMKHQGMIS